MSNFIKTRVLTIPEGVVTKITKGNKTIWKRDFGYVSFGDSIAAGHTINADWEKDYGTRSQYGANGNTSTAIVPNCYTDLIRTELEGVYGGRVSATSFAKSGDRVDDLLEKLSHDIVRNTLKKADLVTACIGANDVLEPALSHLEEYINTGDLSTIAAQVDANLAVLNDDSNSKSYRALFNRMVEINPNAQYVFTTIYNPYKYLYIEEGTNGFFRPILDTIPQMTILGFEIDELIKDGLLSTPIVQTLFSRVNGLSAWTENYVTKLNNVLKNKINGYRTNFAVADTKALFDTFPDRPISATKHYNDLVNVEYTRGYDTAQMDWGQLWGNTPVGDFWWNLANKYVSLSGLDINGFATELVQLMIEKVIVPDIDPHPEWYGHYALKRSFADALNWQALTRYTIAYNANGGTGNMATQELVTMDGLNAYTNINNNAYSPGAEGYYYTGWNTAATGSGTSYTNGQLIGINRNINLYAQWSNIYKIYFKHTNHTGGLYGDNETGHQECYALWIDGQEQADFGTFASGSERTILRPYGSRVGVVVSNYNPSELTYDDCNCDVYWNGTNVASGYRGTNYTFTLTSDVTVEFQWKIAGSLVTFDARSWEDCYIVTHNSGETVNVMVLDTGVLDHNVLE